MGLITDLPHDHFGLRCSLFYFAFCCHDWAFWPSTREGEGLFYLQLTVQQGKSRQELKAGAWCINHREANKAYWLPGHIQPPSSHNRAWGGMVSGTGPSYIISNQEIPTDVPHGLIWWRKFSVEVLSSKVWQVGIQDQTSHITLP